LIHAGLETGGQRGFAPRIASYLAPKYGYAAGGPAAAHARVRSLLSLFGERLGSGRDYFFEDRPTALDVYLASAVGVFHPLSESDCPMLPAIRQAYETTDPELQAAVGPALLAHRDRMYGRHLPLPVQL
jgi:glutathione S-transferase